MAVQVIPWQMKDADGNLLSPNTYTNTIYDPDGNLITNIATEREIGNAYDSSKTYPTYSPYCIHNNKFYKYSGASGTTTTGAWDSTKWTETPIANELSLLNSNLTQLIKSVEGMISSSGGDLALQYPTGFTFNNSTILSLLVQDGNGNWRYIGQGTDSASFSRFFATQTQNGITVSCMTSAWYGKNVRVVLGKI